MKRISICLTFLLIATAPGFSQHGSLAHQKLADSLYRHHHYQHAVGYYQKALKNAPSPGPILLQLAKSYNKINNLPEAEKWFEQAQARKASFSTEDYYEFAHVLVTLKKKDKAEALLQHILTLNPDAYRVKETLEDIQNTEKYYQDSAQFNIRSLPINSAVAEFSPAYYKDGIVFSSAKQEGILRKKYHWDNSHFLNLYHSTRSGDKFGEPELFEKDLNTRHHDGPAAFYDQFQKMILNRNQSVKVAGREDTYELRPGLFDATFDANKSTWKVTPLPFNNPEYSYAHPSVSENGSVLFFASDMPGGYGGNDLYRVTRINGTWGIPFNLGPSVNTPEDEAFPFFVSNTLYFASEGHGGLGGLDIFQSELTTNGFAPPKNMGYPINSTSDDFSLISEPDQRNGYFASNRTGNDDLFTFIKIDAKFNLFAHIFDGETNAPLSGADIQIITNGGYDQALKADGEGNFDFELPADVAYVVIGNKDDKIGMISDIAAKRNDVQQIAAYSDTTQLACITTIKDEDGLPKEASVAVVTDETTGQVINYPGGQSLVSFLGKKGHTYLVHAENEQGDKAEGRIPIALTDKGTKTLELVLPNSRRPMEMAAKIYRADNGQVLGNAAVKIITFGETDQDLAANTEGIVEFALTPGTAYVVIGSKDDLTGMHSGMAEKGTDKGSIIHPVPAYGDRINNVLAVGLVTNTSGDLLDGFKANVTNKSTGETIPVQVQKGILTFLSKRGESYNVNVGGDEFETSQLQLEIPADAGDVEKFAVVLEYKDRTPASSLLASQNIPKGSGLLVVDTKEGNSKAFLKSGNALREVTEENGTLFIATPEGKSNIGKGSISSLKTDPKMLMSTLELPASGLTTLRNIYFDFDKSNLDEEDKNYLQQVKSILDHDGSYKLVIAGHADDRGRENYNFRLSQRRTKSVTGYLNELGVAKERITQMPLGETMPAVPCASMDCSEEQHQMNRRAEFVITSNRATSDNSVAATTFEMENDQLKNYDVFLANFGDKRILGVSYRVTVGAYKKKHDLLFPELSGLGSIESVNKSGVTYYYLGDFPTLKEAENIRLEVVRRGVKDATVSYYNNGSPMSFQKLSKLME